MSSLQCSLSEAIVDISLVIIQSDPRQVACRHETGVHSIRVLVLGIYIFINHHLSCTAWWVQYTQVCFQSVCLVAGGGGQVDGLVGKVAVVRTMMAALKRGLHGFPLSSCTCHYGITDTTSTLSSQQCRAKPSTYLHTHTDLNPQHGRDEGGLCQREGCACWSLAGTHV